VSGRSVAKVRARDRALGKGAQNSVGIDARALIAPLMHLVGHVGRLEEQHLCRAL